VKVAGSIVIVLMVLSVSISAQKKGKRSTAKMPVIHETVTVKAGPYTPPVYPAETEPDIWNDFSTKDGAIKITFPAKSGGYLFTDSEIMPDGKEVVVVTAYTANASYKLITRPVAPLLNNGDIDDVLESSINLAYSLPKTKIISKKNISYGSFLGKEVILSTDIGKEKEVQYARFYLLNSNLIAIYVTLDNPNSGKKMEPWVNKFFASLFVILQIKNEA
jgi:hypothetical protein